MFSEATVFALCWVVVVMGGICAHLVLMLAAQDVRERRLSRYAKAADLKADEAMRKAECAKNNLFAVLREVGR